MSGGLTRYAASLENVGTAAPPNVHRPLPASAAWSLDNNGAPFGISPAEPLPDQLQRGS
jgi:hypothetical protein